jgi:branched-subunit amino acid permease
MKTHGYVKGYLIKDSRLICFIFCILCVNTILSKGSKNHKLNSYEL